MTALAKEAVRSSPKWPLARAWAEFDAAMAPCPSALPITTLLAADEGWDWLQAHPDELVAAAKEFVAAIGGGFDPGDWLVGEFRASGTVLTLVTRGRLEGRTLPVAVLDIEKARTA